MPGLPPPPAPALARSSERNRLCPGPDGGARVGDGDEVADGGDVVAEGVEIGGGGTRGVGGMRAAGTAMVNLREEGQRGAEVQSRNPSLLNEKNPSEFSSSVKLGSLKKKSYRIKKRRAELRGIF